MNFPGYTKDLLEFQLRLPPSPALPFGFSGTVDALLEWLRDESMSLLDIRLASVIEQYLGFLRSLPPHPRAQDAAAEFCNIAASLIEAKSSLLAPDRNTSACAALLEQIANNERERKHSPKRCEMVTVTSAQPETLSLLDLMVLCRDVQAGRTEHSSGWHLEPEITVAAQMEWIRARLPNWTEQPSDIRTWLNAHSSRKAQACLFLALLEMAKTEELTLEQVTAFGPIMVSGIEPGPDVRKPSDVWHKMTRPADASDMQ